MLEQINQVLLNNAGQKLTPELLNGMAHAIRLIVEQSTSQGVDSEEVEETEHVV